MKFGYPLITVVNHVEFSVPFIGDLNLDGIAYSDISWSDLFRVLIIPTYVMVVSNLVNMHSGYNGLQSGLSIILLTTLIIESWQDGLLERIYPASAILGSMFGFWYFNKYPSKVFEGNIGSMLFGSVLGCIIVIQQYWWFGFFILLPHTLNFLLWGIWLIMMRIEPEMFVKEDGTHRKFGLLREDGTLEVPNALTLKWIPNYIFKLTEFQSTVIIYFSTFIFCIIGVALF